MSDYNLKKIRGILQLLANQELTEKEFEVLIQWVSLAYQETLRIKVVKKKR